MPLPWLIAESVVPSTVTRIAAEGSSVVPVKPGVGSSVFALVTLTVGAVVSMTNSLSVLS